MITLGINIEQVATGLQIFSTVKTDGAPLTELEIRTATNLNHRVAKVLEAYFAETAMNGSQMTAVGGHQHEVIAARVEQLRSKPKQ